MEGDERRCKPDCVRGVFATACVDVGAVDLSTLFCSVRPRLLDRSSRSGLLRLFDLPASSVVVPFDFPGRLFDLPRSFLPRLFALSSFFEAVKDRPLLDLTSERLLVVLRSPLLLAALPNERPRLFERLSANGSFFSDDTRSGPCSFRSICFNLPGGSAPLCLIFLDSFEDIIVVTAIYFMLYSGAYVIFESMMNDERCVCVCEC